MAKRKVNGNGEGNWFERPRLPYMPLYVRDWFSSATVQAFTLEQRAVYFELLLRQWDAPDCTLPKDDRALALLSGLGARWPKVGRPIIRRCFVLRDGGYVNPRCREEWEHVKARNAKAKQSVEMRWEEQRRRASTRQKKYGAEWLRMLAAYGRCLRCGSTSGPLHRDHIIPTYQGGPDTPQNWQPLCKSCNSVKGPDRTDHRVGLPETDPAWLPAGGGN